MKIAQIAAVDLSSPGGIEVTVTCLAREITKLGHQVDVVALASNSHLEADGNGFLSFSEFQPSDYDVLHFHQGFPLRNLGLSAAATARSGNVITTFQGVTIRKPFDTKLYKDWLVLWYAYAAEFVGRLLSNRVIAVDTQTRRDLHRFYRVPFPKIVVIPNGHSSIQMERDKVEQQKRKMEISDEQFVFLFVARVSDPQKRADLAIHAFELLRQKYPDVRLICAPGSTEIQGHGIASTGNLDFEDLAQLYYLADALVLTSSFEGFPLCIPEAMAAGVPVVATGVSGIPDVVIDGFNGLLVDRKCEGLVAAMEKVYLDRELRRRLARNALQTAQAYTWSSITKRVVGVYETVLNAG